VEKECAVLPNRVRLLRGNNPAKAGFINYFVQPVFPDFGLA
jgi:hypothetical protein